MRTITVRIHRGEDLIGLGCGFIIADHAVTVGIDDLKPALAVVALTHALAHALTVMVTPPAALAIAIALAPAASLRKCGTANSKTQRQKCYAKPFAFHRIAPV
jgi:hypothetical protein